MDTPQASVPMHFQIVAYQPGSIEVDDDEATQVTIKGSEDEALIILRAMCEHASTIIGVMPDTTALDAAFKDGIRDGELQVKVGAWLHHMTVLQPV